MEGPISGHNPERTKPNFDTKLRDISSTKRMKKYFKYSACDSPWTGNDVAQLRGKVFWHRMNADINKLVVECDLFQGKLDLTRETKLKSAMSTCLTHGHVTRYTWVYATFTGRTSSCRWTN